MRRRRVCRGSPAMRVKGGEVINYTPPEQDNPAYTRADHEAKALEIVQQEQLKQES